MERLTEIASKVMAKYFGISKEDGKRLYQATSGLPFSEQLQTLYPNLTKKNIKAAKTFEKQKRKSYFQEPLFKDAMETIQYLKEKGYTIVISSNSDHELVEKFVKQLGLPCDLALGCKENFKKGLPHFAYIFNHFKINNKSTVFIGDSIKDGEKAKECDVDFIAKEGLFLASDFKKSFPTAPVISALAELKEIF